MYIFKYVNTRTNEDIGYHLSTFCQVGKKEDAKRYTCSKGPEEQRQIILNNLKYALGVREGDNGLFTTTYLLIQERYFKGVNFEEIDLIPEYLTDGITEDDIQYKVTGIIDSSGFRKVDGPLIDVLNEITSAKNN